MLTKPKVLCLFSAPLVGENEVPLHLLDIGSEKRILLTELTSCGKSIEILFSPATTDSFSNSLKDGYNILHYSGHGHPDFLAFEDGSGGMQPVKGDWIKRVLALTGEFQLAVVSACHSENIARELVQAGIPHVVAIRLDTPVLDKTAIVFAREFYRYIFNGDTVQFAFDMAKLMVEGDPAIQRVEPVLEEQAVEAGEPFTPESQKFLLLPDGDEFSRHQQSVCSEVALGTVVDHTPPPTPHNLPSRPSSFTGRTRKMYDVIQEVMSSRLVSLIGTGGISKTVETFIQNRAIRIGF